MLALGERLSSIEGTISPVEKQEINGKIAKLRKDLIDATPYLPSYDQRVCELVSGLVIFQPQRIDHTPPHLLHNL